jgi:hypothetical protein
MGQLAGPSFGGSVRVVGLRLEEDFMFVAPLIG